MSPGTPLTREEATSNIVVDIILSLVTCGIYNLFWQARQFRVLNAFLGDTRFKFWPWLLLSIVTCGIYHLYFEYVMGNTIMDIQRERGAKVAGNLGITSLFLGIFGLLVVADAIQQHEINQLYEQA